MKLNLSLIETVKKAELTREVTFLLKDNKSKITHKNIKREVCNSFDTVNRNLIKRLDHISKISTLTPRRVTIKSTSPSWPIFNNTIGECFDSLIDISNLRVIVNFEEFNSIELNERFLNSNITHLIEISLVKHNAGDLNSLDGSSTTIYVNSVHKVIKIIEDVMLDISLFYTLFDREQFNEINFRKNFSFKKVAFIIKNKLESNDWNPNRNKGYVAIAGYFWDKNEFDYNSYIKFWESVANQYQEGEKLNVGINIKEQLKRHKDYGELPISKILKAFELMPPGEYVLARLIKIPKRHKSKLTLHSIFGGLTIKRGKWLILKKERTTMFNNYQNYINLFKIVK